MTKRITNSWMRDLAFHYEMIRHTYPNDRLLIVFDIDGTILDTRHMIISILQGYDRAHDTRHFRFMTAEDIHIHENGIENLLDDLGIADPEKTDIIEWYILNFWSTDAILSSHRPFDGVLDVIRWFQLQPNTHIGLNTGRSEHMRSETLRVLNTLGAEYRVEFTSALLRMNADGDIAGSKIAGIRAFQDMGYRVIAMIDNEPSNLKALEQASLPVDMLLVHADTLFESAPSQMPIGAVSGSRYDITELMGRKSLPKHIEFVWHGVDDENILRQFLASNVSWAEMHIRLDPVDDSIVVRRRSFTEALRTPGESTVKLEYFLSVLKDAGKGVKLDIKESGLLDRVSRLLKDMGFADNRIWVNRGLSELNTSGFRRTLESFPGAVMQCPVDSLAYLIISSPTEAKRYLSMYTRWGVNRFSVNWHTSECRRIVTQLQNWGYDVNVYNVPDLESFLQAALLLPKSITSYFNFPKWFYTGHTEEGYRANQPLQSLAL